MSSKRARNLSYFLTILIWLFFSPAHLRAEEEIPPPPMPKFSDEDHNKNPAVEDNSAKSADEGNKNSEADEKKDSAKDEEKSASEGTGGWFKSWFSGDKKSSAPAEIPENSDQPTEAELEAAIPNEAVTEIAPDSEKAAPDKNSEVTTESTEPTNTVLKKPQRDTSKFKTQILSPLIYQPNYSPQNSHLPPAIYNRYFQDLLDESIRSGDVELSRSLIEKMQNINLQDEAGNTLVMRAVQFGQGRILQMLLAKNADSSRGNSSGQSPLHVAVIQGDKNIAEILLSYGAVIDQGDGRGQTPLMYSVRDIQLLEVTKLLLEKSADLERQDMYGRTALWEAVASRNLVAAELLMQRGANVDVASDAETTALMAAAALGQVDAAALLLQAGADPVAKDRYGRTAYDIALQSGMSAVAEMLNSEMARQTLIKDRIGYAKARHGRLKTASALLYRASRDAKTGIPIPVPRPTQEIAALPVPSFGAANNQNYFQATPQNFIPAAPVANPQIMPWPTYGVVKPPAPVPPPPSSVPPPILTEQKSPASRDPRDEVKLMRAFR